MAAAFAFLGMLLVSLVVAWLAAFQLGDFFRANTELAYVLAVLTAFVVVAMTLFIAAYVLAGRVMVFHVMAVLLAVGACALVWTPGLVPWIATHSTNPHTVGIENTHILIEMLAPALLAVLSQWGLVRRRWLRAVGQDDFPLWPWITTVVAALAILNPLGLSLIWSWYKPSGGDLLRDFFVLIVAVVAAVLVVMALVECYIRWRVLRRRLAGARP